jgi:hypothetical protein
MRNTSRMAGLFLIMALMAAASGCCGLDSPEENNSAGANVKMVQVGDITMAIRPWVKAIR